MSKKPIKPGMIQIYLGDGKGKTTAALGQALRATGHGFRVLCIRFMKGTGYSGELYAAPRLYPLLAMEEFGRGCPWGSVIKNGYMDCRGCGECFIKKGEAQKEDREVMELALARSREALKEEAYDMVVLDEIGNAVYFDLISTKEVLEILALKPEACELVMTGRRFPAKIIAQADLVTEMKMVNHPFTRGIPARRGIEY